MSLRLLHLKGANVSVFAQMVTMLVTAVIPGIRSTKQDNNSSKQLPFVRNENVCGSSLAGGRRPAGARHRGRAKDGVTRLLLTASLARQSPREGLPPLEAQETSQEEPRRPWKALGQAVLVPRALLLAPNCRDAKPF